MSYFEFPHTRSYDGDLGFIIKRLEELTDAYNNFFDYNTIKFHDPITWTITEDYPANNIVYDELSETFYIAKKPVPAGIDISNTDYWLFLTPFKTDTALDVNSINPIANKPVALKFDVMTADINELNSRLADEIAARVNNVNEINSSLSTLSTSLSTETEDRESADTLINARIDEIISGASVDPDAELLDIRVGGNGITYNTAGDAVRGQYTELNNKLTPVINAKVDKLTPELTLIPDGNIYNSATFTENGYVAPNGNISSSTTYGYSAKIPVEVGATYTFWALYQGSVTNANVRFLCAYNGDTAVSGSGSSSSIDTYTVPANISSIVISFEKNRHYLFMVVKGTTAPWTLIPYQKEHYIAKPDFIIDATQKIIRGTESIAIENDTAVSGTTYILTSHLDNKKNCVYNFYGKFDSFTSLEIGHGKTEYNANYMVIDDTNITSYKPDGSEYAVYPHGLTFTDFIQVSIKVADTKTARATVTINTNGGGAVIDNVIFFGSNGAIYYICGQNTTAVSFRYDIPDLRKDIMIFGDSYIGLADPNRWPAYAIDNGDNNMLLCGFGGADSQDVWPSLVNLLNMKKPKYLAWFIGMNDPDTSSQIDNLWIEYTSNLIALCEKNGIIPILATIPNTPSIRHTYKNAWIKNSGYRYVDFAKAVGAESAGSSWYSGMLSDDNVHPTALGAHALWLQVRIDMPEICGG